jgi:hypothetical protein
MLANIAICIVSINGSAVCSIAHPHLGLNNGSVTICLLSKFVLNFSQSNPILLKQNLVNIHTKGIPRYKSGDGNGFFGMLVDKLFIISNEI